ncbi:hypothetical protein E2C01_028885 [Portunus trituberculatus]|uniref:Uncharacterized protein n=1 Tax=Portunus trituberculatus TaxID=210409 RepID=A0A5B7EMQ5_PORTR|nr:hypothetical protein [Portunus trituberculatus]
MGEGKITHEHSGWLRNITAYCIYTLLLKHPTVWEQTEKTFTLNHARLNSYTFIVLFTYIILLKYLQYKMNIYTQITTLMKLVSVR